MKLRRGVLSYVRVRNRLKRGTYTRASLCLCTTDKATSTNTSVMANVSSLETCKFLGNDTVEAQFGFIDWERSADVGVLHSTTPGDAHTETQCRRTCGLCSWTAYDVGSVCDVLYSTAQYSTHVCGSWWW